MEKNKKTIILIFAIIAVILVGIGLAIFVNKSNNKEQPENNEQNQVNNETENIIEENELEPENIIEENTVEENETNSNVMEVGRPTEQNSEQQQPQVVGKEEQESKIEEAGKTDDEKALELAKNKWGENSEDVKFVIENRNGNEYRISVRDVSTTAALTWYIVDIQKQTVEE